METLKSKKTESVTFKTDKITKEKLLKIAENERRTLSQIVQFIVEDYFKLYKG